MAAELRIQAAPKGGTMIRCLACGDAQPLTLPEAPREDGLRAFLDEHTACEGAARHSCEADTAPVRRTETPARSR